MTFNLSLKNALLFFVMGLISGVFLFFLWNTTYTADYPSRVNFPSPKQLEKRVTASETFYAKKVDSINAQNSKLATSLSETNAALEKAKKKTTDLKSQLLLLSDKLLKERGQNSITSHTPCDSIANLLPVYIAEGDRKDSLYETVVSNLESQLQNKDSLFSIQGESYSTLKTAFTESINAQTILAGENKFLTKTVKVQRTKSKILSSALAILSGVAAAFLLHH